MMPALFKRLFVGGIKEDERGGVAGYDDAPFRGISMAIMLIGIFIYSMVTERRNRKK